MIDLRSESAPLKSNRRAMLALSPTKATLPADSAPLNGEAEGRESCVTHVSVAPASPPSARSRRAQVESVRQDRTRGIPSQISPSKARRRAKIDAMPMNRVPTVAPPSEEAGAIAIMPSSAGGTSPQPALPPSSANETRTALISSYRVSHLAEELTEVVRLRQDYVNAQGNLDRQIKRIVSRMTGIRKITDRMVTEFLDSCPPAARMHLMKLIGLRDAAKRERMSYDKACEQLAEQLPVCCTFVEGVPGFGLIGLALIVGEAGDLAKYSGPAKLWKRFGLHVLAGRSGATWKSKGGLSSEAWKAFGYCPRRRSIMFVVVDSLLRKTCNSYRAFYLEAKAFEKRKADSEGLTVCAADKIPKGEAAKYRSLKHIDLRARRKVAKRLLKDLWRAWRDQRQRSNHLPHVPAPSQTDSPAQARGQLSPTKRMPAPASPA